MAYLVCSASFDFGSDVWCPQNLNIWHHMTMPFVQFGSPQYSLFILDIQVTRLKKCWTCQIFPHLGLSARVARVSEAWSWNSGTQVLRSRQVAILRLFGWSRFFFLIWGHKLVEELLGNTYDSSLDAWRARLKKQRNQHDFSPFSSIC